MLRSFFKYLNRQLAKRAGFVVLRSSSVYPWQIKAVPRRYPSETVDETAINYLSPENPQLAKLREAAKSVIVSKTEPPVWTADKIGQKDLLYFRGDNAYIWQSGNLNMSELAYCLTYYYSKATCPDLLDIFDEDGSYGVRTHMFDGRLVSRDVLDSVQEVDFLRRHLRVDRGAWNIMDIGAGYGRLVYRLYQSTSAENYFYAADAVPESTFIAQYYFSKTSRALAVPLHKVDELLCEKEIHLATNVHSFSECSMDAIEWWIRRLKAAKVTFLMVIPNRVNREKSRCLTNLDEDMQTIFETHGYELMTVEPRYADPVVQEYGIDPSYIFLFKLSETTLHHAK